MNLYEITTGWMGESYERCYAWAVSEEFALAEFEAVNSNLIKHHASAGRWSLEKVQIKLLFAHDSGPFCTKLSDEGWEA